MSAYGLGELPGTSAAEAADMILGETGELLHFPLLPARGLGSDAIGRTAALLEGVHVERGPRSWRLSPRPQLITRAARDRIERDIEECGQVWNLNARHIKIEVTGPWSLAAALELPDGHLAITDRGARRDLSEALLLGLAAHIASVRRQIDVGDLSAGYTPLTSPKVSLQIDEPLLPVIRAGRLPGSSDFERIPAVNPQDFAEDLAGFIGLTRQLPIESVLLNQCGYAPDWEIARASGADTVQVTLDEVRGSAQLDGFGETITTGTRIGLGITGPGDRVDELLEAPRAKAVQVAQFFDNLGVPRTHLVEDVDVHPRGGISTGTISRAAGAYAMARVVEGMLGTDSGDL